MKKLAMKTAIISMMIICSFVLTDCATIVNGSREEITVNSTPPGAEIYINGQLRGTTPNTFHLKRSKDYKIALKKDGYKPYEDTIESGISWWLLGNILFGGLIGVVIDAATGSML